MFIIIQLKVITLNDREIKKLFGYLGIFQIVENEPVLVWY